MAIKKILAAAAALSLATASTVALAQEAPAPAVETIEGQELRRDGFILPLAIIVALLIGVIFLIGEDNDAEPLSP